MFRMLYRVGLLLGAAILALFIGARLIYHFDPYRLVTEDLLRQLAAEPQRTVHLNEYGTLAQQLRQMLHTEEAAAMASWLDDTGAAALVDMAPIGRNVQMLVLGVDTAVHQIAAFNENLEAIESAESLSRDLARLQFYDVNRGDVVLAGLARQSQRVSGSLDDVSEGLEDVATAVAAVTTLPALDAIQQEMIDWQDTLHTVSANGGFWGAGASTADTFAQLIGVINGSIEAWQGIPANMRAVKRQVDADVAWLDGFEQQVQAAKVVNERWQFDTLRLLPRFVAQFHRVLLMGVIGSLLLALLGWIVDVRRTAVPHRQPARVPQIQSPQPRLLPRLAFCWPDGRRECQELPAIGELTIGNIVIRRARVRYYLERIDNAFPAQLNGRTVGRVHILNDGDVLQIGELQTVFQLAA
ncbi:MAG: hypothetical protein IPM53_26240 [Anaerolineaceae bacterium]|nr:hypothetical protein [Anaerolineaceae bacterium]